MQMPKLKLLIGKWITSDEDSRVFLDIAVIRGEIAVRAFDPHDREEFKVSAIKWNGVSLAYNMTVPSNGYKTRSIITPISKNRFLHKITFEEIWHRRTEKSVRRRRFKAKK
jgi:hypothetical protein